MPDRYFVAIDAKTLPERDGWYNVFTEAEPNLAIQVWFSTDPNYGFQTKQHSPFPVTHWLTEVQKEL